MSLINQMLEDLEKRGEANMRNSDVTPRYAQYGANLPNSRLPRTIFLVLCILLLSATAYFFLRGKPSLNEQSSLNKVEQRQLPPTPSVAQASSAASDGGSDVVPIASLPLLLKMSTDIEVVADKSSIELAPARMPSLATKEQVVDRDISAHIETKVSEPTSNSKTTKAASVVEIRRADGTLVDLGTIAKAEPELNSSAKEMTKSIAKSELKHANASEKTQAAPIAIVKEVSPQQRAEGEFKQATIFQQQGRNGEAILALEQALKLDPNHAAARQLMISLFLEGKRYDDAIRELKQGLALDVHQINFAMILARLLVERAKVSEAVDVLQRSVAYAQDRPDYLAFMAALLQKLNRHKESVQYYKMALAKHAQNAVWWMGMGISLQADGATQEALEAYRHAKLHPGLGADLLAFVDQRIAQIQK
mgnify:CR=1 FL=1